MNNSNREKSILKCSIGRLKFLDLMQIIHDNERIKLNMMGAIKSRAAVELMATSLVWLK